MATYNMLEVQPLQYERSGGLIRHTLGGARGMALQLPNGMEATWAEVKGLANGTGHSTSHAGLPGRM